MDKLGQLGLRRAWLRTLVRCVTACGLVACAEGYEGVEAIRQSAYGVAPGGGSGGSLASGGAGGSSGTSAGGMSGGGGATAGAAGSSMGSTGSGTPCLRGEIQACTCVDKGTMGQQTCVFDSASPLDGFYSECSRCPDPAPPPDPGDVEEAGSGGSSGSGGSAGRSGSGGSGGSGSGGSGGSSPPPTTGGGSRTCSSPCNQPCFPIGIIACCNPLGVCGCTWAPGGYCL